MNWNTALARVLKKGILLPGCGPAKSVRNLQEKNKNANMTVTIAGISGSSAVVDMHGVDHPGCVVEGEWRSKCDYLIFTVTDRGTCVILVELKTRLRNEQKPFDQLMKTRPIVEYLVSMGRAAGGPPGLLLCGMYFSGRSSTIGSTFSE